MFILRIIIVSNLIELSEINYEGIPLLHLSVKFLFYRHYFVIMFQVFGNAIQAKELLLAVWASFDIAIEDLNPFSAAAARNIVRGSPGIIFC